MNDPIRVLCVFSRLDRGGAETMCMNLYRNIDRSKVQFDFVKHTHEKCAYEDEIIKQGGRIFEAPRYRFYNHFSYCKWWREHLKEHPEHQIVHGHYSTISPVYFPVCAKYGRVTVGHSHYTAPMEKDVKHFVMRRTDRLVERYSDYCLACSIDAGNYLFHHKSFNVLHNAIDVQKYVYNANVRKSQREKYGLQSGFIAGHVGRFDVPKNHVFLIDVFSEIAKQNKEAVFVLVGDGPLRSQIQQKVEALGLTDSVIFMGVRDDVQDLLQMMDVFLFPSLYEGLGIVAVEAQAASLQVVCSDVVPHEVKMTELVEFISLNESPKYWADRVLSYSRGYARYDTSRLINDAGYEIHETAKWLQEYYKKILKK